MSNPSPASKTKIDLPTPAEVDELGQLQAWLALKEAEIKPRKDRAKELSDKCAAAFEESLADESYTVDGKAFTAIIGARGNKRSIVDLKLLYKRLTPSIFFKICSVPLGKLDAMLEESKHKGVIEWAKTGTRSVEVVAKVGEPA